MKRILVALVLLLGTAVVYQQQTEITQLQATMAYLQVQLNLSVLDSIGVVTDGRGWGSGVAIAPDIILTAGHIIGHSGSWVEINGQRYKILSEWRSDKYDIGFLKIDGEIPYLRLSLAPNILQPVYLVGTPYNKAFENTITKGIISKLNVSWDEWIDLIQVDAEGAPGSSGGPLLDQRGRILGVCVSGPNPGGGVTLCKSAVHIKEALEEYQGEGRS